MSALHCVGTIFLSWALAQEQALLVDSFPYSPSALHRGCDTSVRMHA